MNMDIVRDKLRSQISSGIFTADDVSWQQKKAGNTRKRILDSAAECLVEKGYAGLSTSEVIERAGVSRGALHHHFADRLEMVDALTEYICYSRLDQFVSFYADLLDNSDSDLIAGTKAHWKLAQTPAYTAYVELLNAARTDPSLADLFFPISRRLDAVWHEEMQKYFPQWGSFQITMQLASDFTMALHMGAFLHGELYEKERVGRVNELLNEVVQMLLEGKINCAQSNSDA